MKMVVDWSLKGNEMSIPEGATHIARRGDGIRYCMWDNHSGWLRLYEGTRLVRTEIDWAVLEKHRYTIKPLSELPIIKPQQPKKTITFFYDDSSTYTAKVIDYEITKGKVLYKTQKTLDKAVKVVENVEVDKAHLLGVKIQESPEQVTVIKFKKKASLIGGIIK